MATAWTNSSVRKFGITNEPAPTLVVLSNDETLQAFRIENGGEPVEIARSAWAPPQYDWPEMIYPPGGSKKIGAGPVRALRVGDAWEFVQYDGRLLLQFRVDEKAGTISESRINRLAMD